uniref:Integrase catalytic domain-containing protein n=1 Tax=Cynoglossus semilaevis TaxID=244447 RepID=A0A3P8V8B0_CYNSE
FQRAAQKHVQQCIICLKHNAQGAVRTRQGSFPMPKKPFKHLHMDYIELNQSQNQQYCLVIVCAFSKWTEIQFLKTAIFPRYGFPEIICSDNGTHFTAACVRSLLTDYGITHKLHAAYHPQSAGLVEIVVIAVADTGKPWPQCLDMVRLIINTTRSSSTGLTPVECIFHQPFTFLQLTASLPENDKNYDLQAYLRNAAKRKEQIESAKALSIPQKPGHDQKIQVGDLVFLKATQRTKWSDPRWNGPYKVLLTNLTTVRIAERPSWIHVSHCKLLRAQEAELRTHTNAEVRLQRGYTH